MLTTFFSGPKVTSSCCALLQPTIKNPQTLHLMSAVAKKKKKEEILTFKKNDYLMNKIIIDSFPLTFLLKFDKVSPVVEKASRYFEIHLFIHMRVLLKISYGLFPFKIWKSVQLW